MSTIHVLRTIFLPANPQIYFLSCVKLLRTWCSVFVPVSWIFLEDNCNLFVFQLVPKV